MSGLGSARRCIFTVCAVSVEALARGTRTGESDPSDRQCVFFCVRDSEMQVKCDSVTFGGEDEETSTRFFTIRAGAAGPAARRSPPAARRLPPRPGQPNSPAFVCRAVRPLIGCKSRVPARLGGWVRAGRGGGGQSGSVSRLGKVCWMNSIWRGRLENCPRQI